MYTHIQVGSCMHVIAYHIQQQLTGAPVSPGCPGLPKSPGEPELPLGPGDPGSPGEPGGPIGPGPPSRPSLPLDPFTPCSGDVHVWQLMVYFSETQYETYRNTGISMRTSRTIRTSWTLDKNVAWYQEITCMCILIDRGISWLTSTLVHISKSQKWRLCMVRQVVCIYNATSTYSWSRRALHSRGSRKAGRTRRTCISGFSWFSGTSTPSSCTRTSIKAIKSLYRPHIPSMLRLTCTCIIY